ncbi:MAG: hypothetical protein AAGD01_00390 [Acidobacteriota bacterium]
MSLAIRSLGVGRLAALEGDEFLHFPLCVWGQVIEILDKSGITVGEGLTSDLIKELPDAHVELTQNAEKRIETDSILALLHAREIGLLYADAACQLRLRESALLAQLANLGADELNLTNLRASHEKSCSELNLSEYCGRSKTTMVK